MKQQKPREIIIIDDQPVEAVAMLQALYSRSPKTVRDHLDVIKTKGWKSFMANFYVGYGHKSIGDCGTTSIFIELVSMLAAKAVQDWGLYNGQEASTRYLDMSAQEVLNPLDNEAGCLIQDTWMQLYSETLAGLISTIEAQFPIKEGENPVTHKKAIKAKAFDIARGLLPAGATTYLSWHTNLRQAQDHLQEMQHHPLPEVREMSAQIRASLIERYPDSFSHKQYEEQESYLETVGKELTYWNPEEKIDAFTTDASRLDVDSLVKEYKKFLTDRPIKTELPRKFQKFGLINFSFPLDFGSYRDLQRHRNCIMMMPLLTTERGFFPWYLEQLPAELRQKVEATLKLQETRIAALKCPPEIKQYYVAMGYTVACEVTTGLPAAVYLAELRAGQTVHPTLRVVAQDMTLAIKKAIPCITLHSDMSADEWNIKRGTHDIIKKS